MAPGGRTPGSRAVQKPQEGQQAWEKLQRLQKHQEEFPVSSASLSHSRNPLFLKLACCYLFIQGRTPPSRALQSAPHHKARLCFHILTAKAETETGLREDGLSQRWKCSQIQRRGSPITESFVGPENTLRTDSAACPEQGGGGFRPISVPGGPSAGELWLLGSGPSPKSQASWQGWLREKLACYSAQLSALQTGTVTFY